jgi:hypothetical protein
MFDRRAANQRVQNGSNKHGLVATTNVKQQNCNIPLSGTHFDVGFGPSSGSGMFQSSFCVRFLNSFSQFRLQDSFGDGTFRNIANNLTRESKNNDATTKSRGQQQRRLYFGFQFRQAVGPANYSLFSTLHNLL